MNVHFSSETDLWATPQDLFDQLNAQYHFETDVCAIAENAKCARYFTPEQDGLKQEWTGSCFMNPPYGRGIGAWLKKAYESARGGGNGGLLNTSKDGYALLARIRHKRRHHVYSRAA